MTKLVHSLVFLGLALARADDPPAAESSGEAEYRVPQDTPTWQAKAGYIFPGEKWSYGSTMSSLNSKTCRGKLADDGTMIFWYKGKGPSARWVPVWWWHPKGVAGTHVELDSLTGNVAYYNSDHPLPISVVTQIGNTPGSESVAYGVLSSECVFSLYNKEEEPLASWGLLDRLEKGWQRLHAGSLLRSENNAFVAKNVGGAELCVYRANVDSLRLSKDATYCWSEDGVRKGELAGDYIQMTETGVVATWALQKDAPRIISYLGKYNMDLSHMQVTNDGRLVIVDKDGEIRSDLTKHTEKAIYPEQDWYWALMDSLNYMPVVREANTIKTLEEEILPMIQSHGDDLVTPVEGKLGDVEARFRMQGDQLTFVQTSFSGMQSEAAMNSWITRQTHSIDDSNHDLQRAEFVIDKGVRLTGRQEDKLHGLKML